MGFLNTVVSFSIVPTFSSTPLLSVCFSSQCVCSAVCSLENLNVYKTRYSRKAFRSTELKCFQSCTLNSQVSDHMPSSFVDFFLFCFPFPLFLLQLSERARERKVPVTRIGRLANFGGQFAHPHLWSHYACTYWLMAVYDSAPAEALVGSIFWLSLLIGKCFSTNSFLAQSLIWAFSLQLGLLIFSQN